MDPQEVRQAFAGLELLAAASVEARGMMRLAFNARPEQSSGEIKLKPICGSPLRDLLCGRAWLWECLSSGPVSQRPGNQEPSPAQRRGVCGRPGLVLGNQARILKTRSGMVLWSDAATCWLAGRLRATVSAWSRWNLSVTGSYSLGFHVLAPMIGCLVEIKY